MKILVIDDNPIHQKSAIQTLNTEHTLTVLDNHDDAVHALRFGNIHHREDVENILTSKNLPRNMEAAKKAINYSTHREDWFAWCEAEELAEEEAYWDAVLCDLIMPAGEISQGREGLKYIGQEMSIGWSLAITAAIRGASYVAVATDMNHHHHPASAMLDSMNETIFNLNGARALFTNYTNMIDVDGTSSKNWRWILQWLLTNEKPS